MSQIYLFGLSDESSCDISETLFLFFVNLLPSDNNFSIAESYSYLAIMFDITHITLELTE